MTSSRRQRISRVIELREKQLEARLTELARARHAEKQAQHELDKQREALESAFRKRLELTRSASEAVAWTTYDEWLRSRSAQHEVAQKKFVRARVEAERAQAHVVTSRTELKKVESLSSRLLSEEKRVQGRKERRAEDESAEQRARRIQSHE